MGSSVNFVVAGFIEKMASSDKDFRYMATNDLMNELKKETFKVDSQTEQRMVSGILKLLEDNNGEVQNLVVKCLPLMVNTISEKHLEDVVDTLCRHLSAGVEELRDVASIGLKSVIMEIPTNSSVVPNLCKRLTPKLLSSLQAEKTSYEVKMDSLDLLTELLSRFGTIMVPYHQEILGALIVTLSHARPAIRKRSSTALGHLVKHLNDKQFLMLVGEITAKLSSGQSTDMSRSYASCLATVSRSAGKRLSRALDSVSPILLALLGKADDELRESAFQALEYLVLQCQSEVSSLIPATLDKCLELIKYDPNYVDDDNEDEEMAADEDGEEESEGEYSDDDDMSWKVRRAASKTLAAVIFTRSEMLPDLLKKAGPVLVARFGEREENVRVENYNTFVVLLRKVGAANRRLPPAESQALRATLQGFVPKFCKAVAKSLRDKSQKTKQAGYSALKETVQVLNGGLDAEIAHFAQALTATLGSDGTSSALKIEILSFMGAFFRTHSAASFAPLLKSLVPQLVKATKEKFYKVASEALSACSELVQAIRPVVPAPSPVPAELLPYVGSVFAVATEIMTVQDVDQEVKERAIACFGNVISHAGDSLQAELDKALPLLMDKVSNEITRLVAVKTLVSIARSPLNINLAPFMEQIISELATFLRKANRSLRVSSLLCLNALVSSRGGQISEKQLELVVHEVKGLINDSDLQILPLSLTLLTSILKVKPACYSSLSSECLPAIFLLLRSPLLQGASLQALLELFETIVKENSGIFDQFLQKALEPAQAEDKLGLASSKQPFSSIAQSIGVFCRACPEKTTATSQKFIAMITKNGSDVERYLGLLTLGEIGKLNKMESDREVYETVLSFFLDNSEEVKSAAAFALGNIAVGDLGKFVPMILAEIQNQPKKQYLLLHSLKEVIAQEAQNQGAKNLLPFAEEIWSILIKNCESEEEGTRSAVAECLGKLAMTSPSKYLPALKEKLASDSALTRATCVMAVKFTFTIPSTECEGLFKALIQTIAPLSRDSNLTVRRVSLQALNSAAHNKPGVVRELLPMLLPILYEATQIEKDLIKLVTMGPFKYEVDEGLDARKAAYECLLTILSTCHDILNTFEFLERISQGLQDKFDIKILCHLALVHLCTLAPSAVQQKVDELLPALEGTINNKLKDTAVKQEIEKNEELVRSALRSVVALSKLPETEGNDRFSSFFKSLKASPHRAKLDSVITEMESRESTLDVMDTS